MSKSNITLNALMLTLLVSNGLWAYALYAHRGPTHRPLLACASRAEFADQYDSVVLPLIAAISASAEPGADRDSIAGAARKAVHSRGSFCMEQPDVVRVRDVGLKFDQAGRLVGASITHCPPLWMDEQPEKEISKAMHPVRTDFTLSSSDTLPQHPART
jgi:hypothetical protein